MENIGVVKEELVVVEEKDSDAMDESIDATILELTEATDGDIDESTENFVEADELNNEELIFSESSSDDDSDDKSTTETYVNVVGKKMNKDDIEHAQEMKQNMKEFFTKCSPDVSFSTLVQLFIQRLTQPKPVYVLASDVMPNELDINKKYAIVCAVSDCENAYIRDGADWESIEQTKNFFGFPTNEEQCKMWIESIGRLKYLKRSAIEMQNYRVCEVHFADEDFTSEYKDELTETAVPSLFLNIDSDAISQEMQVEE